MPGLLRRQVGEKDLTDLAVGGDAEDHVAAAHSVPVVVNARWGGPDTWPYTAGELSFYGDAEAVVAERVAGLDLREHPVRQKQLSNAARTRIRRCIESRTATREEWERYMWDKRLAKRRKTGIQRFWAEEGERLARGEKGTRNWTAEQREAILSGDKPRYNGKTMQAHHTHSVMLYPHLANDPAVLYPATPYEHLKGWHGAPIVRVCPVAAFVASTNSRRRYVCHLRNCRRGH